MSEALPLALMALLVVLLAAMTWHRPYPNHPHAKSTPCPEFVQQFLLRVQDVIDSYSLDILNFDDGAKFVFDDGGQYAPDLKVWLGIPDLAPQIMAFYCNKNMQAHAGRLEGVVDLSKGYDLATNLSCRNVVPEWHT
jgi:hypothetical protein